MKSSQPKIYLSLLVFVLSVTPNACLLEQAIAALAHALPHGHHEDQKGAHGHDAAAPSHKHDDDGHKEEFCCDNSSNFYLFTQQYVHAEDECTTQFQSESVTSVEFQENPTYFQNSYRLHRLRQPIEFRGGDRYALTCLLHAPPYL